MSSRIVSSIFPSGVSCSVDRKSAAMLSVPATCAILRSSIGGRSEVHEVGGFAFVWKNLVTDLLSVMTNVGNVVSHSIWLYSRNAW